MVAAYGARCTYGAWALCVCRNRGRGRAARGRVAHLAVEMSVDEPESWGARGARQTYSEDTRPGSWPGSQVWRVGLAGLKAGDCTVLASRKRGVADESRTLRRPEQVAMFESREAATVAGRLLTTLMGIATKIGRQVDPWPVL